MSTRPKTKITRIIPARRWMSVDSWLKRYDEHRDPHGVYGCPGRDPQNILTKAAS